MIHTLCRGTALSKSVNEYKTVAESDFKSYPEKKKTGSTSSCRRVK